MASFPLQGPPQFPDGTSVAAYPLSNWNGADYNGAPPVGSATESKTVTSGVAAFVSLAASTRYVAYALVSGQHRYVRFLTDPIPEAVVGGTGSVYAQQDEPTIDSADTALWVLLDAEGRPTGELRAHVPPPTAPTGLTAVMSSHAAIDLSWTDNSTTETGFEIQQAEDAVFTSPTTLTTVAGDTTTQAAGLDPETLYYYRVRAVQGELESDWSATASATTDAAPDPADFDLLTLTPHVWLKADAITGKVDGDAITSWTDSSGNSRHATDNAITARRPSYQTAVQNSLPAVEFDGTDDCLVTPSWTGLSQPNTVLLVAQMDNAADRYYFDGILSTNRHAFAEGLGTGGRHEVYAGTAAMGAAQSKPTGWNVWTLVYNGASSSIRKNGAAFASTATNIGTHTLTGLMLGANFNGSSGRLDGFIGELVLVAGLLDAEELANAEAHLLAKWAIS